MQKPLNTNADINNYNLPSEELLNVEPTLQLAPLPFNPHSIENNENDDEEERDRDYYNAQVNFSETEKQLLNDITKYDFYHQELKSLESLKVRMNMYLRNSETLINFLKNNVFNKMGPHEQKIQLTYRYLNEFESDFGHSCKNIENMNEILSFKKFIFQLRQSKENLRENKNEVIEQLKGVFAYSSLEKQEKVLQFLRESWNVKDDKHSIKKPRHDLEYQNNQFNETFLSSAERIIDKKLKNDQENALIDLKQKYKNGIDRIITIKCKIRYYYHSISRALMDFNIKKENYHSNDLKLIDGAGWIELFTQPAKNFKSESLNETNTFLNNETINKFLNNKSKKVKVTQIKDLDLLSLLKSLAHLSNAYIEALNKEEADLERLYPEAQSLEADLEEQSLKAKSYYKR